MERFHLWWFISFLALLLIAFGTGKACKRGILGILIDGRGRYSLTHFQIVLWTILILSSVLAVLISNGCQLPKDYAIPHELLGLMGISAGSAVLATGVKASKDGPGPPNVAKAGPFTLSNGTTTTINPRLAQIWLVEEGDLADQVVDVTKYQNFIFTLVTVFYFVAMTWQNGNLPKLPDGIVWLIGISHAGYVGGKVPDKK
jgi:hypothetical protein